MEEITYKQVHEELEQYLDLRMLEGHTITVAKIDSQFNYASRKAKRYRWQVLNKYVEEKRLERLGVDKFRLIDGAMPEVNWQNADVTNLIELKYPMDLQKWVKTYPKSIIMVAGEPGAGKTAFLEHITLKNMYHPMGVHLFNNDMSEEEIKERMDNAGIVIPVPAPFKVYDRDCAFADVIFPNGINIIDYLDLNSELYMIGAEIENIYRKLERGIAIIGLQKKPGQKIGLGGIFSWKRSKLYFSLSTIQDSGKLYHQLEIVKARGRTNPQVDPNGMRFKFKLVGGIKFGVKEIS